MTERPNLDKQLNEEIFRNFYYLKEELVSFCRVNGIPASGGKIEITDRIAKFLSTGKIEKVKHDTKIKNDVDVITEDTIIEPNFICSEKHRVFFKEKIGNSFTFNVIFQKWLKSNAGKTYAQAIEAYYSILNENKKGISIIDKQFEYNTYIRAFFKDNPDKSLKQAIKCWNYKKSLQGHNRYENIDLIALNL